MISKEQARKILDRNEILLIRAKSRMFGNMDTTEKFLSSSEVFAYVCIDFDMDAKLSRIFETDDAFYKNIKRRKTV